MKKIALTNSPKFALVDDEDEERVKKYNWNINGPGYAGTWINKRQVMLHSFVMKAKKGQEVDHKDLNKLNCQKHNLRFCTHSQNRANSNAHANNKLGVKGVDFHQGRYRATIRVNYKKIYLGSYDTIKKAAKAYNEAAKKYFGEFAKLNKV